MLQWDHPIVLFSSAFCQAPDHPCKYNMHQQIAIYHTKVHFFPHLSLDLKEDSDRHPNIFPS
jgi:hypothetical protein